jgi:hypothetical protein
MDWQREREREREEITIPLGPEDREIAHLIAAVSEIPRLGDQLYLCSDH